MPNPKVISPADPRMVSIKKRDMIDPEVFNDHYYSNELLNIFTVQPSRVDDANTHHHCRDKERTYLQNSKGMRGSEEFDKKVDLLAIGCSQTFGLGIDEDAMWSKRMATSLEMSYATIAAPGWSIQEMVSAAIVHIKKYGKPKLISALLPDFGRVMGVESRDVFIGADEDYDTNNPRIKVRPFHYDGHREYPKLSKAPHIYSDVMPTEAAIFTAAQSWAFFIEYCNAAEIELVWTSWDAPVLDSYSMVSTLSADLDVSGFVYNKYHLTGAGSIDKLQELSCHQDLKEQWPTTFDVGSDSCQHYGVHAHAHIAEMLAERYRYLDDVAAKRS